MGLPVAADAVGPRLGVAVAIERQLKKTVYQCAIFRRIAATPKRGPTCYTNIKLSPDSNANV